MGNEFLSSNCMEETGLLHISAGLPQTKERTLPTGYEIETVWM
jgi:hypothetical protein